jgi:hypothetical protein
MMTIKGKEQKKKHTITSSHYGKHIMHGKISFSIWSTPNSNFCYYKHNLNLKYEKGILQCSYKVELPGWFGIAAKKFIY